MQRANGETVTAEVILKTPTGRSVLDSAESITGENVGDYRVGEEVIEQASRKLRELGCTVLQSGAVSLSISAERAVFEQAFNTTLEPTEVETEQPGERSVRGVRYRATKPIQVPRDMQELVAHIVLPTPPIFYP